MEAVALVVRMAAATEDDVGTAALVAYLRNEAALSEQKAISLRAQAAALAAQFGISEEMQQQYGRYSCDLCVRHFCGVKSPLCTA